MLAQTLPIQKLDLEPKLNSPYMEIDFEKWQIEVEWFYKIAWLTNPDSESWIKLRQWLYLWSYFQVKLSIFIIDDIFHSKLPWVKKILRKCSVFSKDDTLVSNIVSAWLRTHKVCLKPSLFMRILSINNFTTKLLSKLLSDLYIGVHLKGTKKFGSKVINGQLFHRKTFLY